jgi:hypothetical protein
MKNLFAILILSLLFVSCKDNQSLPSPSKEAYSPALRTSNCAHKTSKVQDDMTSGSTKKWLVFYYDTEGSLIQHPFIDNVNGTVYEYAKVTDSTGIVNEYNISSDSLVLINYGTYTLIQCGEVILPNTEIFDEETQVLVTKSNPVKFETRIDAPLNGPNAPLVTIVGKGIPY